MFAVFMVAIAIICLTSPEIITNHLSHWIKDNIMVEPEDQDYNKND